MAKLIPCGVRLQVRADRPAGLIRAFYAADDGSFKKEVATLAINLADDSKALFDAWVKVLSDNLNRWVSEATGVPLGDITGVVERLSDKN